MKTKIEKLLVVTCLLLCLQTLTAQIGQTRAEIIKDKGYNYTSGVADDGTKYIFYEKTIRTNASGEYTQSKAIYFTNIDDGTEICYMWKIIEPASETNTNVTYYKGKYVETAYMQWKDYEINIIYDITVKDGLCIITAWYDNKK